MTPRDDTHDREPPAVTRPCRICGQTASSHDEHFPFCSQRCRMADLGKWFNEDYKITREIKESDIETVD
jgi:uncharacterized protein